jgi:hypothetical protein
VQGNVISGNRGAALQGRPDVNLVIVELDNDLTGNSGGPNAIQRAREHR